jgi:hypothetical protein
VAYPVLARFKRRMDHRRYNGAALLGLRGLVFKSHGSADALAFEQALARAYDAAATICWNACRSASPTPRPCSAPAPAWQRRPPEARRPVTRPIHKNSMRRYSRITGTGSHLPPRRVTNDDLVAELAARGIETSDDWIVERTGIRARHFAAPDVQPATWRAGGAGRAGRPRGRSQRHRPDHRRHLHAGHGVPVHRRHPAAQAGHGRAARCSTCRRCAAASSTR